MVREPADKQPQGPPNWLPQDFFVPAEQPLDADPWDGASTDGLPTFLPHGYQHLQELDLLGHEDAGLLTGGDDPLDNADWDEPEPTAEPRSELSEVLYPPDLTIDDLSVDLRIGEFLACVPDLASVQKDRCFSLLKKYSTHRLRRILPWLRAHQWSCQVLLSLLEFRRLWELSRNVAWWEAFRWREREREEWIPSYQPSALTWEAAEELVRNRLGVPPSKVIDPAWYEDWCHHRPWLMGVRSFAGFILYRSGLRPGTLWLEHLARVDRRNATEVAECNDETFAPFMLPSILAQYGSEGMVGELDEPPSILTGSSLSIPE